MNLEQAIAATRRLESQYANFVKVRKDRQYQNLDKALNQGSGTPEALELARSIRPGRIRKGSILEPFAAESNVGVTTGASEEFGHIGAIDLVGSGPGNAYGERHSGDAFAAAIAAQYPTIPELQNMIRPSAEPNPFELPLPKTWSGFEARAREAAGQLDSGTSQSIVEALGFPDLSDVSLKAALVAALRKGGNNPHVKEAMKLCKAFSSEMPAAITEHYENLHALHKAHVAAVQTSPNLQHVKNLTKAHIAHVKGVHENFLNRVTRLHKGYHAAMHDLLNKAEAAEQPVGGIAGNQVQPPWVS
jgi:hypothetical protein